MTESIDHRALRIYVVWEPILENDSFEAAEKAAVYLQDPRVRHFWAEDQSVGQAFQEIVGSEDSPAWDVFLAYGPRAQWREAVPTPDVFMHDLGDQISGGQPFDARELATSIRDLLASSLSALLGDEDCGTCDAAKVKGLRGSRD